MLLSFFFLSPSALGRNIFTFTFLLNEYGTSTTFASLCLGSMLILCVWALSEQFFFNIYIYYFSFNSFICFVLFCFVLTVSLFSEQCLRLHCVGVSLLLLFLLFPLSTISQHQLADNHFPLKRTLIRSSRINFLRNLIFFKVLNITSLSLHLPSLALIEGSLAGLCMLRSNIFWILTFKEFKIQYTV